jgi:hypothetical protein
MRSVLVALLLAAAVAGCGGGGGDSLGTVPNSTNSRLVTKPLTRPIVVRLRGTTDGTAHLRRAANGQKTAVSVELTDDDGSDFSVELAQGSCTKPQALKSPTVLGELHSGKASWTVPTPYAQLTASPLAVVVRSGERAVEACGNAPRG